MTAGWAFLLGGYLGSLVGLAVGAWVCDKRHALEQQRARRLSRSNAATVKDSDNG